jgi:hypothetical protein
MQTAIAAFPGFAVVAFLVLILERMYAMWLCRKALRDGRGFRWKGGLRPSVEVEAVPNLSFEEKELRSQQPGRRTQ